MQRVTAELSIQLEEVQEPQYCILDILQPSSARQVVLAIKEAITDLTKMVWPTPFLASKDQEVLLCSVQGGSGNFCSLTHHLALWWSW